MIGGLANFDVPHRRVRWGVVEFEPLSGARLLALVIIVIVFSGPSKEEHRSSSRRLVSLRDAPQLDAAMPPAPAKLLKYSNSGQRLARDVITIQKILCVESAVWQCALAAVAGTFS